MTGMGAKGAIPLGGLGAYTPDNFAKFKRFWCVFHDFQPINLLYRLHLNNNASFSL